MDSKPTYKELGRKSKKLEKEALERKRTEKALQESEEKFKVITASAKDAIIIMDNEGNISYWNEAAEKMFGYSVKEAIGKEMHVFLAPQKYHDAYKKGIRKFKKTGRGVAVGKTLELEGVRKDGTIFPIELSVSAVKVDEKWQATGIIRDITQRKETEESLRESENSYRTLSQNLPGIVYRGFLRENNRMKFFNNMLQPMTGFTADELVTGEVCSIDPLILPEDRAEIIATIKNAIAHNQPFEVEYRLRHKEGGIRYFLERGRPIRGRDGNPLYIDGVIFDITKRRQAEESLLRMKNFSEAIIDSLPGSFYLFDDKGVFLRWNKNFEEVSGYSAEEIAKMNILDFFVGEDKKNVAERIQEVFVKGKSSVEADMVSKNGDKTPYYFTGLRIIIDNKTFLGGMGIDITKRKRAEDELKESEEKYRIISGTAQDAIVMMDNQGNISYWNPAAERIFGYKPEEAIGKELHLLIGQQGYHQAYKRGFKKFRETGQGAAVGKTLELSAIRKDGTEFPIELSVAGIQIKGTWHATGIIRDITERKEAEEALRKAHDELEHRVEERTAELASKNEQLMLEIKDRKQADEALRTSIVEWRSTFDAVKDAIILTNLEGKILKCNKAMINILGKQFGEILGYSFWKLMHSASESIRECFGRMKDSRQRETIILPLEDRWVNVITDPMLDETNSLIGGVCIISDITKLKRADEALRKSEKELRILSAQLLATQEKERERVAHELHDSVGQALTAIKFRVENTLGQLDKTSSKGVIESLETVVPVVQYATEEVRRIAMGLRPSTLDDFGLLATINWFCREFQHIYSMIHIKKYINIEENEVPEHLKTVIYRIVQESLNNVAKHSNADLVHLSIGKRNSAIELVIKDNGFGFDLEDILSSETSGKRLGLNSMKKRTEISGGVFNVESKRGAGTIIRASWPAN